MGTRSGTVKTYRGRLQGGHRVVLVHRGESQYRLRALPGRSEQWEWGPGRNPGPLTVALLASTFGNEDAMCYVCEGSGEAKPDFVAGFEPSRLLPKVLRSSCPDCAGSGLNPMLERLLPFFEDQVRRFSDEWEITDTEIMAWAVEQSRRHG